MNLNLLPPLSLSATDTSHKIQIPLKFQSLSQTLPLLIPAPPIAPPPLCYSWPGMDAQVSYAFHTESKVNYINAHVTSNIVGDLAEVNAMKKVFKNTTGIKMNATKSMIGHWLGAVGDLESIATVKAINTGWLHPTINQFICAT